MATKIKIKLTRDEYQVLNMIVGHVASNYPVDDAYSLYVREELEKLAAKFAAKKWKQQKAYSFSLTISETVCFMEWIGEVMYMYGGYERAMYDLLYTNEIVPQMTAAIQIRTNFKNI